LEVDLLGLIETPYSTVKFASEIEQITKRHITMAPKQFEITL
jgi:hypothetical protein